MNRIIRIGIPFIAKATTSQPKAYFMLRYNPEMKFDALNLTPLPKSKDLPDRMFPNRKEKFEFTEKDLVSIRVYFLPGPNPKADQSKSILFKNLDFTPEIISDFKNVIDILNSSKITSSEKGEIQEQKNTNDLKAIIYQFKDGNETINLSVLNPSQLEKYVEVNTFYIVNAAIHYQISDTDKIKIQTQLNKIISKYLK